MYMPIIDAHIHFDHYSKEEQKHILQELEQYNIEALLSVSFHLESSKENLRLHKQDCRIKPAFGFHPEQSLPSTEELEQLFKFMVEHKEAMIAVGEVGLPYYMRKEQTEIPLEPYIEVLEEFVKFAKKLNKPVALHAVYEDAPIVCDLLEKHSIEKAHFHWFKGDTRTIERMIANNYHISITPDLLVEGNIQSLAEIYPLTLTMVETDGPWPFDEVFPGQMTHPKMIHETVKALAKIKSLPIEEVYKTVYNTTKQFYNL